MTIRKLELEIRRAFVAPTVKQKEAYGRFAHTLAAAAIIGDVTIIFGDWIVVPMSAWRVVGLTFYGRNMLSFGFHACEG